MSACPCTATFAEFPTTVVRGDTARWCMTFTDCDGAPINTAGWIIWLILRSSVDQTFADSFKVKLVVPNDASSAAGAAILTIHSTDTATLTPGKYYYEFKRVLAGLTPPDVWTFKYDTKPEFVVTDSVVIDDLL
jgi:hypothetical protein